MCLASDAYCVRQLLTLHLLITALLMDTILTLHYGLCQMADSALRKRCTVHIVGNSLLCSPFASVYFLPAVA